MHLVLKAEADIDPVDGVDGRRFAAPVASEVAVIADTFQKRRDILISLRPDMCAESNPLGLQTIHETHALYLPLAYPVLFPHGEQSWSITLRAAPATTPEAKTGRTAQKARAPAPKTKAPKEGKWETIRTQCQTQEESRACGQCAKSCARRETPTSLL